MLSQVKQKRLIRIHTDTPESSIKTRQFVVFRAPNFIWRNVFSGGKKATTYAKHISSKHSVAFDLARMLLHTKIHALDIRLGCIYSYSLVH